MPGARRLLLGTLLAVLPCPVAAQFAVHFSLSKSTFLAGEPVFVDLTVRNVSKEPLQLETADPLTFCSGYRFALQGARDRDARTCSGGFAGSCLSGFADLAPGKSLTVRVLLNARFDIRRPGRYPLTVSYRATYAPAGKALPSAALTSHQDFEKHLEVVLVPSKPDQLKQEFAPYLKELDSSDWQKRQKAAKVIAYLAPAFMEPEILRMFRTPGMQILGVQGLRDLGTPSARRALTEFLRDSPPTNIPGLYQEALRDLGKIGNSSDVPILLKAAHASAPASYTREVAIDAAAAAGGAAAIPALEAELQEPSKQARLDAVEALPLTGSRPAVPILIRLLQSPDVRLSSFAEYGLESLTHLRGARLDGMHPPPPSAFSKWNQWWGSRGLTATIFKPDQCGEIHPIP